MPTETSMQYESFPSYRFIMTLSVSLLLALLATGVWIAKTWILVPKAQAAEQVVQKVLEPDTQKSPEVSPTQETQSKKESEPCGVSPKYPEKITQWCTLITKQANKNGLDPDLVAALIWQESGGNPQAYSKSGAVGLMQVMPRDGIAASFMCVNGPCFSQRPSMEELYKPTFNVKYGTNFLGNLVRSNGSIREALFRYGPSGGGYYYADKVLGIYNNYKE